MTDGDQKDPIYPQYCHELSPTIGRWCPLKAVDIHALRSVGMYDDDEEIYHHGNHPIKWVRITGVIIAIDEFPARRVFTIDDSSGVCVECTCPAPPPQALAVPGRLHPESLSSTVQKPKAAPAVQISTPSIGMPVVPWTDIDVGVVVKIKGKPNTFRGVKQVNIIKVEVMRSTEQEVRCWNEVMTFRKDILQVPWVVSKEAEDKYRRRAEKGRLYKHGSKKHLRRRGHTTGDERKYASRDKAAQIKKKSDSNCEDQERDESRGSKKRKHDVEEGLKVENRANYPSLAVRRRLAGKYDALGI